MLKILRMLPIMLDVSVMLKNKRKVVASDYFYEKL